MATTFSSSSSIPIDSHNNENNGDENELKLDQPGSTKPSKRTTNPGIRVVGGRIYDSQNGKTCHQCRQKTMDFTAGCNNVKQGNKPCPIRFCQKCLINRYGEKAEETALLDKWTCPKCRGICNCSLCMKKRGHKPTGILVHTAKATGFASVSQLLDVKGPEVCLEMAAKNKIASPKESSALTEGAVIVSPKKRGKENSIDGTGNTNTNSETLPANPDEKKAKKSKKEWLKERVEVKDNGIMIIPRKNAKDGVSKRPVKLVKLQDIADTKVDGDKNVAMAKEVETEKVKVPKLKPHNSVRIIDEIVDVVLPQGALISSLSGIDVLPEDAGHALQFLEFCSTFGEVLDLRKGQAESVLRDIMCGRSTRKGRSSSAVLFLAQLLSFILKHTEEESPPQSPTDSKDSWIHSLKKCLSESVFEIEDIPEDCFDKGPVGYEMLESSQKLKLLTFLCDEALCTTELRDWINNQNAKFVEKAKEDKESLNAAKEKGKLMKRKMHEDVAKAVLAKNGAPLTIEEHSSILAEIKAETNRAHEEMLEVMNSQAKKKQRPDAVRTELVLQDDKGRAFWRLNCYGDSDLLLQDVGGPETTASHEKWFGFNAEEAKLVEKHISSVRLKKQRENKLIDTTKIKSCNPDSNVDSSSNEDSPTEHQ